MAVSGGGATETSLQATLAASANNAEGAYPRYQAFCRTEGLHGLVLWNVICSLCQDLLATRGDLR